MLRRTRRDAVTSFGRENAVFSVSDSESRSSLLMSFQMRNSPLPQLIVGDRHVPTSPEPVSGWMFCNATAK